MDLTTVSDAAIAAMTTHALPGVAVAAKAEQARRSAVMARIREAQRPFREAQEAAAQAERERQQAAREAVAQARRDATEAMLKRWFLAAGGTEAQWEVEKRAVIAEHRRRQVFGGGTADARARIANAARYG
jgi:hypothetical protein